jgi:hypothetical protein
MFTSTYLILTPLKSPVLFVLVLLLALSSCATQKHTLSFNPANPLQHAGQKTGMGVATDTARTATDKTEALEAGAVQNVPPLSTGKQEASDMSITASNDHEPVLLLNEASAVAAGIHIPQQDTNYVREPKARNYQDEPLYTNVIPQHYSVLSIISLVCGALGLMLLFTTFFPFLMGTAAVVLGILGLRQIRKEPSRWKGKGFAIAGLITGILTIILFWFIVALLVLFILSWGA